MSDVKVGMRLRSTISRTPMEEFATVTELTERGFKYSLDASYPMIPRWGMSVMKDGHEHFGLDGEAFFEVIDQLEVLDADACSFVNSIPNPALAGTVASHPKPDATTFRAA